MNRFIISAIVWLNVFCALKEQNQIVQTCYTTDPTPLVVGDRCYVYTGHGEAGADFFNFNNK